MKRHLIEISKPFIGKEEIDAVVRVLRSGNLSQGPLVKDFEEKLASYCGTKYAVALINGTATLHTILHSLGVDVEDEVITTPFTFISTTNAILMQRAKVVFCDIEDKTFNIDPKKIEEKITKRTKVIMPADLYGHMYDVESINSIAKRYGLFVVEDAAQAVGAEYKNRKAGSVSDAGSFSLYATKNLTAGLGGMIATNNKEIMEKSKLFRHHGQPEDKPYEFIDFGYNYRMMDMVASIGLEQLKKIDMFTAIRRENAKRLTEALSSIKGIITPTEKSGFKHVFHQYTIRITGDFPLSRDEFIIYMAQKGIICRVYYPRPLHFYPHIKRLGFKKGDFPVAESISSEVVSIPVHPLVNKKGLEYIIKVIKKIASR